MIHMKPDWREPQEVEKLPLWDPPIPLKPVSKATLPACGNLGPYIHFLYRNDEEFPKYRRCNRPYGHSGNHIFSTVKDGPIAEWTRDDRKVRPL